MAKDPDPPPAPLIKHPAAHHSFFRALPGDRAGLGDGGRLGERELGRLVDQRGFRGECVLREPTHQREVVAVHLVAGSEPGDSCADGVDHAGDVRAKCPASGGTQPADPCVRGRSAQALPVAEVDRGRGDSYPELTGGGGRYRDVLDMEHIGGPVPVVDHRLHTSLTAHLVMPAT